MELDLAARLLYRDALMLVLDKPARAAGACRAEGWPQPCRHARRAELRPAAPAGAGAPPRQGYVRLPRPRPPRQGPGAARDAVRDGQGRQDLLGDRRGRPIAGGGPDRYGAGTKIAGAGLVDAARSRWAGGGDTVSGSRARGGPLLARADAGTGRTHQLRVHCAASGYPILGDAVYGTAQRFSGDPRCRMPAPSRCRSIRRRTPSPSRRRHRLR